MDVYLGELLGLFLVINVIGLVTMYFDKWMARMGTIRIPEKWILAICLAGGTPGVILGMFVFHHKNKKRSFQLHVLVVAVFYVIVLTYLGLSH